MTTCPASLANIRARWPDMPLGLDGAANAYLAEAWSHLRMRLPSLEARVIQSTGGTLGDEVVGVLCAMVLRVLRNPDGKISEKLDDYGFTRSPEGASGGLCATPSELARLSPGMRQTRGSIRLTTHGEP